MFFAIAVLGSSILGGISANAAASTQASASEAATSAQQQMFNQEYANQQPYVNEGYQASNLMNYLLGIGPNPNAQPVSQNGGNGSGIAGSGGNDYSSNNPYARGGRQNGGLDSSGTNNTTTNTSAPISTPAGGYGSLLTPFTADMMKQYSPAYQFQLQQGQQGVLNGDEGSVGALSGAAQKDLMSYNQNAANTAFNNAFNQYQTQTGNIYQRLGSLMNLGQSAASNSSTGASNFANGIGQSMTNTGTALASAYTGTANAVNNGLSNYMLGSQLSNGGGVGFDMSSNPNAPAPQYSPTN